MKEGLALSIGSGRGLLIFLPYTSRFLLSASNLWNPHFKLFPFYMEIHLHLAPGQQNYPVAIQEYGFSINNPDTWGHRDYIQYIRRFKNSRFLCNTVGRTIVGYTLLAHYKRSDITHYAGKTAIPFILPPR